ncbi:MAG: UDP-N-acetylglucosamine 2-epimerase (non-hydrolyzing) [Candidatus Aminicenantes bacterium]|nr:UDP-N-acetylglucosamine 2-epimerase (non-hydrolyzing) [Candidatus Aminicenantes bacterium]
MKIITVLGTRPEIIRLSLIIKKLDKYCDHILIHTGQNYEESLSDIFFKELEIRTPDYLLSVKSETFGKQVGKIFIESENTFLKEKPDAILILGDTNSGLTSVVAKRLGITVFHMEAGNRCFDDRVPEEVNRRVIDHSSDILMPYTHRSKENLIREGIERERIFVIGNPIYEVINNFNNKIEKSLIFQELGLKKKKYFLVTMHRAENVDLSSRLNNLVSSLDLIGKKYQLPIICSLHPRTKNKMESLGLSFDQDNVRYLTPLGFLDFVALEKNAYFVLSDSGTVQEECCILNIPNLTIRDVTERPETIESGSNILTGVEPELILKSIDLVIDEKNNWIAPEEYLEKNVSSKVLKIILGYYENKYKKSDII